MTMKRICTICARAGSKGVKNKNIRELQGKPLLAHSLLQAKSSEMFVAVSVSSDSEDVLSIAKKWGADYCIRRPDELARDESSKIPAIRHCVIETERILKTTADEVVDLDVTAPLRTVNDIQEAISLLERSGASNVITGTPARRSPYFNQVELDQEGRVRLVKPLPKRVERRQDAPPCFDMNASIYVWRRDALFRNEYIFNEDTKLYVMPAERSHDIDTELDFSIVEFLMQKYLLKHDPPRQVTK